MNKTNNLKALGAALLMAPLLSGVASAQSRCGDAEALRADESIGAFAERCNVPVEAILAANPDVSRDELQGGLVLLLPQQEERSWADRARDAVRDAGRQIEGAATEAGRSVSDYLSDQPDLNRDILEFGERLGLPGVSAPPDRGAGILVGSTAGVPGDQVEVTATGLPGGAEGLVGAIIQDEFVMLTRATADTAGRLNVEVEVPEVPETEDEIQFVVRTSDGRVSLGSEPFAIHSRT